MSVTGPFGEGPPVAMAVVVDEVDEDEIFVGCPRALLQAHFLTARSPAHSSISNRFFPFSSFAALISHTLRILELMSIGNGYIYI